MERSHSTASAPVNYSEAERAAVREQLDRMLANPMFKNSKRYPNLLRYVVDRTLEGTADELKERTLGVEVFGREPRYDTNADPVVRATAGKIRKLIAQYCHEPGHENELRIDLVAGSYIPEFRFKTEPVTAVPLPAPVPALMAPGPQKKRWMAAVIAMAAIAAILVAATFLWVAPRRALDQFWRPILDSNQTALLCVGQRPFLATGPETPGQVNRDMARFANAPAAPGGPVTLFQLYYMGSQNVALADVMTMGRLTGFLQAKGKPYHMRGESSTTLSDLRDSPVVLIGAFNNDWTLRLIGTLRFSFERDGDTFRIQDRLKPKQSGRSVDYSTPYMQLTEDWALITRVFDPTTERPVVVAAGLTGFGTFAAGEFLTDPKYMEQMAGQAPRHWERRNVQILISTRVISGNSGPPQVVATHFC